MGNCFFMMLVLYIKIALKYQSQKIKIEKFFILSLNYHLGLLIVLMLNNHKYKMNYFRKNKST